MSSPNSPRKVHLVGSRIRELRKGRHLTQTELSERIGVAQSDLSRMEQGEYKVGLDTLFKILQVFDLKMGEFFGETEQPVDPDARGLMADFQDLSEEARREVRDFVRFKRLQQEERGQDPEDPEEESPAAPPTEEKP
ncbi:MAG: helix-turn-helix domain-containing protein [Acidobacteriota bacterium]